MVRKLTMMIVDDETIIRRGLKNAVEKMNDSYEVIALADDGETALNIIREENIVPDVIITDIYMNFIDGIELLEELTKTHPSIRSVILSGHEEFQLAKKAINLKVQSYLIKPVSLSDLDDILQQLNEEMEKEEKSIAEQDSFIRKQQHIEPYLSDKLILDLLEGRLVSEEQMECLVDYLPFSEQEEVMIGTLRIMNMNAREHPENMVQTYTIKSLFESRILEVCKGFSVIKDIQTVYFGIVDCDVEDLSDAFRALADEIEKNYQITIIFGFGERVVDFQSLVKSTSKSIEEVEKQTKGYYEYPFDEENELQLAFSVGDTAKMALSSQKIINKIKQDEPSSEWTAQTLQEIMFKLENILKEIDSPYPPAPFLGSLQKLDMLTRFERWIHESAEERMKVKEQKNTNVLIETVKLYLKDHYADQELSLQVISEVVSVTPNYLTQEFRKITGLSCMQYVTQIRMDKAKQLLRNSDKKIFEIADIVGYDNPYYFSNAFKKNVGKNPSSYKLESRHSNEII
ncbi:response regulator transcription factor [Salipaludibacillus daqingensis]|uniref:response regulator transcription factor n=1 Tax=Salipaludibacillus daqingensis TaxID=3041001 RepID=UPI00247358C2|nr:response regulator [Salipaludibacillus daqingensis]